jgi:3'(2'), 5'-bisphosphate nucleotidase
VTAAVQAKLVTATGASGGTLQKKDKSPVTVADFASQAVVCAALSEALPHDAIVAEEDARELRSDANAALRARVLEHVQLIHPRASEPQMLRWIDQGGHDGRTQRYWTLDPIDGTKGFLRNEQYAVALALIENGQVVLGVLGCPNLDGGVVLTGVQGQGAKQHAMDAENLALTGEPVAASEITSPRQARLVESVESGHSDQDQSVQIARKLGITEKPLRMDSQVKYAMIARGDAQVYLRLPTRRDYREKVWDHAAGMMIVHEAGGTVTDVDGKPLDFTHGRQLEQNRGVVATGGRIHDAVLKAVRASRS